MASREELRARAARAGDVGAAYGRGEDYKFIVNNLRSAEPPQEFDDRETADEYARILNDRYPDAKAWIVAVRRSPRARAHLRRL
jgi:hypothetical protein